MNLGASTVHIVYHLRLCFSIFTPKRSWLKPKLLIIGLKVNIECSSFTLYGLTVTLLNNPRMDLEIFQRVGLNILKFGDVLLVSLGYKK
jgi:hypothetical protein